MQCHFHYIDLSLHFVPDHGFQYLLCWHQLFSICPMQLHRQGHKVTEQTRTPWASSVTRRDGELSPWSHHASSRCSPASGQQCTSTPGRLNQYSSLHLNAYCG